MSNSNERGLQAVKFIIDEHDLEGAAVLIMILDDIMGV